MTSALSSLAWLDHDAAARERSLRILSLFQERDSRDELGLGGIRDSIADHLFPGTSTIHTRLRYMLFIPWVYRRLEEERVPASEFGARARQRELDLIGPLRGSDHSVGVIGGGAGRGLKRLPSDAYWAGLRTWGIRRFDLSKDAYHRAVDRIYASRAGRHAHADDDAGSPGIVTWHRQLPAPPDDFPGKACFALTPAEAEYLRDAIVTSCPESLIAWLAREQRGGMAEVPWQHPDLGRFPEAIRRLLRHAGLFSMAMQGAAILYNLCLAELDGRMALAAEHRATLDGWASRVPAEEIAAWSLDEFWTVVRNDRHTITPASRRFVESWVERLRQGCAGLAEDAALRGLVERRERALKKARSRFANAGARLQWGGHSGLRALTYRWETARSYLDDLQRGLRQA